MKKGFTLVELLAVIAILAILIILALPNVLGLFMSSKESAFVTEAQNVYKVAQEERLIDTMNGSGPVSYSSRGNELTNLNKSDLGYYVRFDSEGNVLHFIVYNIGYQIVAGSESNTEPILISDLCVSGGSCKYKAEQRSAYLLFPGSLSTNSFIKGDVDRNGNIDEDDLIILNDYISGNLTLDDSNLYSADVNSDGSVNQNDATELDKHLKGKPSVLNNKVTYTVEHYKQKVTMKTTQTDAYYDLFETDQVEGILGAESSPLTKNYEGFKTPSRKTVTVSGSDVVVKYYYTRKLYKLSFRSYGCPGIMMLISSDTGESYDDGMVCAATTDENPSLSTDNFFIMYGMHIHIEGGQYSTFYKDGEYIGSSSIDIDMPNHNVLYDYRISIPYTVNHYQHKINEDGVNSELDYYYNLVDTEHLTTSEGDIVSPEVKTYTGFTSPAKKTVEVSPNGSTVINYFYERNKYTLTLKGDYCAVFNDDYSYEPYIDPDGMGHVPIITSFYYTCDGGFNPARTYSVLYGQTITLTSDENISYYLNGEYVSSNKLVVTMGTKNVNYTYTHN